MASAQLPKPRCGISGHTYLVPYPCQQVGAGYEVQAYVDFESGVNGDDISTTNINSRGSICTWTIQGTGSQQKISTTGSQSLLGPVKIDSTAYSGTSGTRSYAFDPGGSTNQMWARCALDGSYDSISVAGDYMTTSTNVEPLSIMFGFIDGGGNFSVAHWGTGSASGLHITNGDTCIPNNPIPIAPSTQYWVAVKWEATETFRLYVWNRSTMELIGACTLAATSSGSPLYLNVGRFGSDAESGTGTWYFDNLILSTTGKWPLVPVPVSAPIPIHNNDTGAYSNSVTVAVSSALPEASIVYCTDLTGTCTPNTDYTTPIIISTDGTHLRTKATADGWADSTIKESIYAITVSSFPTLSAITTGNDWNTNTITGTLSVTAGERLFVPIIWPQAVTLSSITATCVSGSLAAVGTRASSTSTSYIHAAIGTVNSTGSCTVTATFSGASGGSAAIAPMSIAGTSGVDVHAYNPQNSPGGTSDAVTSGSVTSNQDNNYVVTVTANGSKSGSWDPSPGTGYNGRAADSFQIIEVADRVQASAGSIAGTWTANPTWSNYVTAIFVFKP